MRLVIRRNTPASEALHLSIDVFTGTLLFLARNVHWVIRGKLGSSRWKTLVNLSVPVSSQAWTAHCEDHYDPQPVKRSSERAYYLYDLHINDYYF